MNNKIAELLNDQINKELYSAYLYLDMANYYDELDLDGVFPRHTACGGGGYVVTCHFAVQSAESGHQQRAHRRTVCRVVTVASSPSHHAWCGKKHIMQSREKSLLFCCNLHKYML